MAIDFPGSTALDAPAGSQNGHTPLTTEAQQAEAARVYIQALTRGVRPQEKPQAPRWQRWLDLLEQNFEASGGDIMAMQRTIASISRFPGGQELAILLSGGIPQVEIIRAEQGCPPLADGLLFSPDMSTGASPSLDTYIRYSKARSPEGFEDSHAACFVWMLSVVAGRRVAIPFAQKQYTPLMIALTARTSLYTKSTTAEAAIAVLQAAGLRWLLGADETTPQKLLSDMAGAVPSNYAEVELEKQERIRQRLAMSAQRGWYYDEFGELVKSILRGNGIMADFKGLLLKLDNCADQYEYSTQKRGNEIIEKPYLALLGCMTPASMRLSGKFGSDLWSDGFWARVAFVCPPQGTALDAPFALGEVSVPFSLSQSLARWHTRLGVPQITIESILDERERPTGRYTVTKQPLPEHLLDLAPGVYDAWKRYRSALKDILKCFSTEDLDGSYNRLASKAIRIAALLASFEGHTSIELRHWAKAQEIAETWRRSLHELYRQINTSSVESNAARLEEEILRHMQRLAAKNLSPSATDLKNYMPQWSRGELTEKLQDLVKAGMVESIKTAHTTRYRLLESVAQTTEPQN